VTSRYQLPPPSERDGIAWHLLRRRSVREYTGEPLTPAEVGRLLWAGQGVSHSSSKRTAPSPRALYPLSLYLVAGAVRDFTAGLYAYDARAHALDAVGHGELRHALCEAALEEQPWVASCAALIVIVGDAGRAEAEFAGQPPDGRRGRRYLDLEAGAAAQNIALQTVELGLGTVMVGGFEDERVQGLLGIDDAPLVMMPLGRPAA